MTTAVDYAKNLSKLLTSLMKSAPPEIEVAEDPVAELIMSVLVWESTAAKARVAYDKLVTSVIDFNELRTSLPVETVTAIGSRYPYAHERAMMLRRILHDIYERENRVSLDRVASAGKREIRKYIESLDGMMPFVASRVLLLCFDTHAIPIDERISGCLVGEQALEPELEIEQASAWLARQIKASDGLSAYATLQDWSDGKSGRGSKRPSSPSKSRSKSASSASSKTAASGAS